MRRYEKEPPGNCPNCEGTGWTISESWSISLMTRQPIRDVKVRCSQCLGTGSIDNVNQPTQLD